MLLRNQLKLVSVGGLVQNDPKDQKHYFEKQKWVAPSTEFCDSINVYKELSYACAKGTLNANIFKGTFFW